MNPKVEEARIRKALRDCRRNGFDILEPVECIKKAIDEFGDSVSVSCSFGSCSVVVLHMALQLKPDIKVVFNNTGVEYPETYAYKDLLQKEWGLNLIETKPIKSFWECVKEYGFPTIRKKYAAYSRKRTFQEKFGKPACCLFLKDKPMQEACQQYGIKATLNGMRVAESRARMFAVASWGQYYNAKKYGIWKFLPIAFWIQKQVREYFKEHGLPMNEVYTKLGLERSGCQPCTGFLTWEKTLGKTNPKMYHYIQKLRGVSLLEDFIALENEAVDKCGQRLLEEWL